MRKQTIYLQHERSDKFVPVSEDIYNDVQSGKNTEYINNTIRFYPGDGDNILPSMDVTLGNAHPWTIDSFKELLSALGM